VELPSELHGFLPAFKQSIVTYFLDVGGLVAGFIVTYQMGLVQLSPWALAVYPGIVSAKSITSGLFSGRLCTALHLGTVHPRFMGNTRIFYRLLETMIMLTLLTSLMMSAISMGFGILFWGITAADFANLFVVVVATMTLGLTLSLLTVKVAFITFKRGSDPEVSAYPFTFALSGILMTAYYVLILRLFFQYGHVGRNATALICTASAVIAFFILLRSVRDREFINALKEPLLTLLVASVIFNITGTVFKRIGAVTAGRNEVIAVYPALTSVANDVGSTISQTATTKLALGLLKPSLGSIRGHATQILSSWIASVIMFGLFSVLCLFVSDGLAANSLAAFTALLLLTNILGVALTVITAYGLSVITFLKGLDLDNSVIPVQSVLVEGMVTVALLAALLFTGWMP